MCFPPVCRRESCHGKSLPYFILVSKHGFSVISTAVCPWHPLRFAVHDGIFIPWHAEAAPAWRKYALYELYHCDT